MRSEEEENGILMYIEGLVQFDTFFFREDAKSLQLDEDYIKSILKWSTPRINKLTDLVSKDLSFLWITPPIEQNFTPNQLDILTAVNLILKEDTNTPTDKEKLKTNLKQLAKNENVSFGKLMQLIRTGISGLKEGPGVLEMIEILGISNTINRLDNFVKQKQSNR